MYYGEEMNPLWNEPDQPVTWMSLGDDMTEEELRDAALQQRADARPYGPLNDDPYIDRSVVFRVDRVRRIRIAAGVRDAVARDAEQRTPRDAS